MQNKLDCNHSSLTRVALVALSVFYLASNCILAHSAETNFWKERAASLHSTDQKNPVQTQLAQLPNAFGPSLISPSINSEALLFNTLSKNGSVAGFMGSKTKLSRKTILHIQDVHANREAQANIAAVLQGLNERHSIDLIGLEGEFRDLDFSAFRNFPYPNAVRRAFRYLERENQVSGPIFFAMTSPSSIPAFTGVDDSVAYHENVRAYQKSVPLSKGTKESLSQLFARLDSRIKTEANPGLQIVYSLMRSNQKGTLSYGAYVKALRDLDSNENFYPQVEFYLSSLKMEETLNFKQAEVERTPLIGDLLQKLSDREKTSLFSLGAALQSEPTQRQRFYGYLKTLCENHGVPLHRYPSFETYLRYVLLSGSVDGQALIQEVKKLERHAIEKNVKSPAESHLVREMVFVSLAHKLVNFSLSSEEWSDYLASKIQLPGLDLSPFEKFYLEASIRDTAIAENFDQAIRRKQSMQSVLVTGGFHSNGIDRLLNEKGYSVLTFTPKVTEIKPGEDGAAYLTIFQQEKSPLEKLFEGDQLCLISRPSIALCRAVSLIFGGALMENPREQLGLLAKKLLRRVSGPLLVKGESKNGRTQISIERANSKVSTEVVTAPDGEIASVSSVLSASLNPRWSRWKIFLKQTAALTVKIIFVMTGLFAFRKKIRNAQSSNSVPSASNLGVSSFKGDQVQQSGPWMESLNRMTRRTALFALGSSVFGIALRGWSAQPKPSVTLPTEWSGENSGLADARTSWIKKFNDPQLEKLIERALANNPSLKIMESRVERLAILSSRAGADRFPSVSAGAEVYFPPNVVDHSERSLALSLFSFWELDVWGRVRSLLKKALHDQKAEQKLLEAVRQTLAADVARQYFVAIQLNQELALQSERVRNASDLVNEMQARMDSGIAAPQGTLSWESELDRANRDLKNAQEAFLRVKGLAAEANLAIKILVADLSIDLAVPTELPKSPQLMEAGDPLDMVERRYDLKAARENLEAMIANTAAAKADRFPRLTLDASGGVFSSATGTITSLDGSFWKVGVRFLQPLLDWQKKLEAYKFSKAQEWEAIKNYENKVLLAFQECQNAYTKAQNFVEQEKLLTEAQDLSNKIFESAKLSQEAGLTDHLLVDRAQQGVFDAESKLNQLKRDRLMNYVTLYSALGGDEQIASPNSRPIQNSNSKKSPRKMSRRSFLPGLGKSASLWIGLVCVSCFFFFSSGPRAGAVEILKGGELLNKQNTPTRIVQPEKSQRKQFQSVEFHAGQQMMRLSATRAQKKENKIQPSVASAKVQRAIETTVVNTAAPSESVTTEPSSDQTSSSGENSDSLGSQSSDSSATTIPLVEKTETSPTTPATTVAASKTENPTEKTVTPTTSDSVSSPVSENPAAGLSGTGVSLLQEAGAMAVPTKPARVVVPERIIVPSLADDDAKMMERSTDQNGTKKKMEGHKSFWSSNFTPIIVIGIGILIGLRFIYRFWIWSTDWIKKQEWAGLSRRDEHASTGSDAKGVSLMESPLGTGKEGRYEFKYLIRPNRVPGMIRKFINLGLIPDENVHFRKDGEPLSNVQAEALRLAGEDIRPEAGDPLTFKQAQAIGFRGVEILPYSIISAYLENRNPQSHRYMMTMLAREFQHGKRFKVRLRWYKDQIKHLQGLLQEGVITQQKFDDELFTFFIEVKRRQGDLFRKLRAEILMKHFREFMNGFFLHRYLPPKSRNKFKARIAATKALSYINDFKLEVLKWLGYERSAFRDITERVRFNFDYNVRGVTHPQNQSLLNPKTGLPNFPDDRMMRLNYPGWVLLEIKFAGELDKRFTRFIAEEDLVPMGTSKVVDRYNADLNNRPDQNPGMGPFFDPENPQKYDDFEGEWSMHAPDPEYDDAFDYPKPDLPRGRQLTIGAGRSEAEVEEEEDLGGGELLVSIPPLLLTPILFGVVSYSIDDGSIFPLTGWDAVVFLGLLLGTLAMLVKPLIRSYHRSGLSIKKLAVWVHETLTQIHRTAKSVPVTMRTIFRRHLMLRLVTVGFSLAGMFVLPHIVEAADLTFISQNSGIDWIGLYRRYIPMYHALTNPIMMGILIASAYKWTQEGTSYNKKYTSSVVIFPLIVTSIIFSLTHGENIVAVTLGVMGALGVLSFRTILRDTLDMMYIAVGVAIGVSVGTGSYKWAWGITIVYFLMVLFLHSTEFGRQNRIHLQLSFTWKGTADQLKIMLNGVSARFCQRTAPFRNNKGYEEQKFFHDPLTGHYDVSYRFRLIDPTDPDKIYMAVEKYEIDGKPMVTGLARDTAPQERGIILLFIQFALRMVKVPLSKFTRSMVRVAISKTDQDENGNQANNLPRDKAPLDIAIEQVLITYATAALFLFLLVTNLLTISPESVIGKILSGEVQAKLTDLPSPVEGDVIAVRDVPIENRTVSQGTPLVTIRTMTPQQYAAELDLLARELKVEQNRLEIESARINLDSQKAIMTYQSEWQNLKRYEMELGLAKANYPEVRANLDRLENLSKMVKVSDAAMASAKVAVTVVDTKINDLTKLIEQTQKNYEALGQRFPELKNPETNGSPTEVNLLARSMANFQDLFTSRMMALGSRYEQTVTAPYKGNIKELTAQVGVHIAKQTSLGTLVSSEIQLIRTYLIPPIDIYPQEGDEVNIILRNLNRPSIKSRIVSSGPNMEKVDKDLQRGALESLLYPSNWATTPSGWPIYIAIPKELAPFIHPGELLDLQLTGRRFIDKDKPTSLGVIDGHTLTVGSIGKFPFDRPELTTPTAMTYSPVRDAIFIAQSGSQQITVVKTDGTLIEKVDISGLADYNTNNVGKLKLEAMTWVKENRIALVLSNELLFVDLPAGQLSPQRANAKVYPLPEEAKSVEGIVYDPKTEHLIFGDNTPGDPTIIMVSLADDKLKVEKVFSLPSVRSINELTRVPDGWATNGFLKIFILNGDKKEVVIFSPDHIEPVKKDVDLSSLELPAAKAMAVTSENNIVIASDSKQPSRSNGFVRLRTNGKVGGKESSMPTIRPAPETNAPQLKPSTNAARVNVFIHPILIVSALVATFGMDIISPQMKLILIFATLVLFIRPLLKFIQTISLRWVLSSALKKQGVIHVEVMEDSFDADMAKLADMRRVLFQNFVETDFQGKVMVTYLGNDEGNFRRVQKASEGFLVFQGPQPDAANNLYHLENIFIRAQEEAAKLHSPLEKYIADLLNPNGTMAYVPVTSHPERNVVPDWLKNRAWNINQLLGIWTLTPQLGLENQIIQGARALISA